MTWKKVENEKKSLYVGNFKCANVLKVNRMQITRYVNGFKINNFPCETQ